jgi:hypothetical protein
VFAKAVNIRDLCGYTVGELVNISTADSSRLADAVLFASFFYGSIIAVICVTGLTWWLIGPAALVGIFCFLLVFPLQVWQYLDSVLHSLKLVYMHDRLQ